jgi:hypothetical protein
LLRPEKRWFKIPIQIALLVVSFSAQTFACEGCAKKSSNQISGNIQSAIGNNAGGATGGARIVAPQKTKDAFANDLVFRTVGEPPVPDEDKFKNWTSAIQ